MDEEGFDLSQPASVQSGHSLLSTNWAAGVAQHALHGSGAEEHTARLTQVVDQGIQCQDSLSGFQPVARTGG